MFSCLEGTHELGSPMAVCQIELGYECPRTNHVRLDALACVLERYGLPVRVVADLFDKALRAKVLVRPVHVSLLYGFLAEDVLVSRLPSGRCRLYGGEAGSINSSERSTSLLSLAMP